MALIKQMQTVLAFGAFGINNKDINKVEEEIKKEWSIRKVQGVAATLLSYFRTFLETKP